MSDVAIAAMLHPIADYIARQIRLERGVLSAHKAFERVYVAVRSKHSKLEPITATACMLAL